MCRRSEYDLYARASSKPARTNSNPARSLVEVLRDLFRPRRPQVAQAEVVPFPGGRDQHRHRGRPRRFQGGLRRDPRTKPASDVRTGRPVRVCST